jgi:hypothetical protein
MISDRYKTLVGKANDRPWMGYAAGEAIVVDWIAGGGFAGAPETICIVVGFINECPRVEMPMPHVGLEVRFGGHWSGQSVSSLAANIQSHIAAVKKKEEGKA